MKLMPLLTAAIVTAVLYMLVIERDALLAFAQVAPADESTDAGGEPEMEAVRVVAVHSTASSIDNAVVLRGRTEAARQVEVRAEISGLVMSAPRRKGAMVETGEILCELDPGTRQASLEEAIGRLEEARARLPEAQAGIPAAEAMQAEAVARIAEAESRVAEARAKLTEAEINENAATRLSQDGFASETRVANATAALESARAAVSSAEASLTSARAQTQSAEAGVEGARAAVQGAQAGIQSAEAAVASARQAISQLSIKAPFGGLMETDAAETGTLLQPGGLCATIIQLDPIKVVGFVPEARIAEVKLGALAGARLSSGRELTGQVSYLSRSADPTTRTFRVEITVDNSDLSILDGQTADILIQTEGRTAHLLPQSALTLDDDGALGVRLVDDDSRALFAPVTLLRDTAQGVWLTGLPEMADVIVVGQEYVIDGVPVDPTYRDADALPAEATGDAAAGGAAQGLLPADPEDVDG
ncbi:efflux RND transporter periplasmic adaptor subunit [Roseisalinus antarcticus]|uniref:Efflux pump periplasmic linker BepF n=1 Tax=Roseisalinus antarcticus TaxID=254357 RepID=A0A1Y5T4R5_9RHOB|nr:efflux RND transporter periplasmic adaptor subunit [Roseisalinus antarcticus]SLN55218.1 Efflux pump periplasmic linker BepF [Roseisalinus antarcticus]